MASIVLIVSATDGAQASGRMSPADLAVRAALGPDAARDGAPACTVPLRPMGSSGPATHFAAHVADASVEQLAALQRPESFARGNPKGRLLRWGESFWAVIAEQGLELVPPPGPGGG